MKLYALFPFLLLFALCQNCRANSFASGRRIEAHVVILPTSTDLDFWFHTPGSIGINLYTTREVFLGQKFTVAVAFFKREVTNGESLDLEYTIRAVAPDGNVTVIADKQPFLVPSYVGSVLLLPTIHSGTLLSKADQGKNVFKVEIRDKATKKVTRASAQLVAKKWAWPSGEADLANLQKYYKISNPVALHQLAFSPKLKLERWVETGKINMPVFALLMFAYGRHDFLLEDYRDRFASCSPFERKRILFLVALTGGEPIEDSLLTEEEKVWRDKLEQLHLPNPYQSMKTTEDLDFLWGEFFATGDYAPVRCMMEALQYRNEAELVDKFMEEKTLPETDADKAAYERGVLFKKTVWSLIKYGQDDDLVLDFLLWAMDHETLPRNTRELIRRINTRIIDKILIKGFKPGDLDLLNLICPPEDSSAHKE